MHMAPKLSAIRFLISETFVATWLAFSHAIQNSCLRVVKFYGLQNQYIHRDTLILGFASESIA